MRAGLVAICALGSVGAAHADDAASAQRAAAQVHLDRGIAAFRAGDFTRALRELDAAVDLVPDKPNPYRWRALAHVQLGHCAEAIANIDAFVARVPAGDERLAELERLRVLCARTGTLAVTSSPPGVALSLDGARVGATPFRTGSIRAGDHVLAAEHPGFRALSRAIVVPAGGQLDVTLDLEPARRPLVRSPWFWAAVAGVAILGTGLALYATSGDDATVLPPIACDPAGCRPGAR